MSIFHYEHNAEIGVFLQTLNIYRGTIILDDQGEAIVSLPAYFKEINANFSYHLTPIGHPSLVYVKEKVNNNNEFVTVEYSNIAYIVSSSGAVAIQK